MLTERFAADLDRCLLPLERFRPFPRAAQREAWLALPAALRAEVVDLGAAHLGRGWASLPATLFLDYARSGRRSPFEAASFGRRAALAQLVVAECAEGSGRFVAEIVDGVWAICEESFWGVPAHNEGRPLPDVQRPLIDLFAAETAALLAWVHYLLLPELEAFAPGVGPRLRHEVERRILDPFLGRDDFWWMGLRGQGVNNWNPWCVSNCLAAGLLLTEDGPRRAAVVAKALRCLDRFLDPHPADGGCDEGPGYWDRAGGALFDCLELLQAATGGAVAVYEEPLVREIGRFLYRAHIDGEWFVNFADAPARVRISADLVHRFGQRIGDTALAALGACAHRAQRAAGARLRGPLPRVLPALFHFACLEQESAGACPPYQGEVWLPVIEVMAARERAGTAAGLYVAAKGGHNAESHNHNDIGQFLIYLDGRPLVVDAGVGTYTAQTFSADRYGIWTMRSPYHNLPTVRGVEQRAGAGFRARDAVWRTEPGSAALSLDIAPAYPPEAGIRSWRRTVRLLRGPAPAVEVVEDFRLEGPTADIRLHLLLAERPELAGQGRVEVGLPARAVLAFDGEALAAAVEEWPIEDSRLQGVWGDRLWRLTLGPRQAQASGCWRLRVSRAAGAAAAPGPG